MRGGLRRAAWQTHRRAAPVLIKRGQRFGESVEELRQLIIGVSQAKVALLVRGDQKLALQATGAAELELGEGFASASATS